jgi:mono/diheme cytochrome c family protein
VAATGLGLAAAVAAPAAAESPRVLYMLHCQGCHRPDGSGLPGAVPALRGQVARFLTVPGGREFLVRVPGSASAPVDDAGLAAVLNWIVARFGPAVDAASAAPYTADEVGRLRRDPLLDVASTRAVLIERLRGDPGGLRGNP